MSVVHLAVWVMLIPEFFCANTTCPPPDFPEGGRYKPEKTEYEVGQTVKYFCNGRLKMFNEHNEASCQSSGNWSVRTPFCDTPAILLNPSKAFESTVFDGNDSTCFPTRNDTEELLRFSLDRKAVIYAAILCWSKGNKALKVTVSETSEYTHHTDSVDAKCVRIHFFSNRKYSEFITVEVSSDTPSSISLCTIEVFTWDDKFCVHPPENSVPNGRLTVSRKRAALRCNGGFREEHGRELYAICEQNKWSYMSLQCVEAVTEKDKEISEDPTQKDYTFLAAVVGSVIALVIFLLLGLTVILIRKRRLRGMFMKKNLVRETTTLHLLPFEDSALPD